MGSVISDPITSVQWLLSESARLLSTASAIVSMTAIVIPFVTDMSDRAEAQLAMIFMEVEDFLTELTIVGEKAEQCIAPKRPELTKIREELVQSLVACYNNHNKSLLKLQEERAILNSEAVKFKEEAEEIVRNCSGQSDAALICYTNSIKKLTRQLKKLIEKVKKHLRKELKERRKSVLKLMKCDREAVDRGYQAVQKIIEEIRHCMFTEESSRENNQLS